MLNEIEILNSLLGDLSNFALVFFGFSISIFTLLYSFIFSRRDNLKECSEMVKIGNNDPRIQQRITNAKLFIIKMRRNIVHFIITVIIEVIDYIVCLFGKYLINCINEKKYVVIVAGSLSIVLFIYIAVLLVCVIKDFSSNTKI